MLPPSYFDFLTANFSLIARLALPQLLADRYEASRSVTSDQGDLTAPESRAADRSFEIDETIGVSEMPQQDAPSTAGSEAPVANDLSWLALDGSDQLLPIDLPAADAMSTGTAIPAANDLPVDPLGAPEMGGSAGVEAVEEIPAPFEGWVQADVTDPSWSLTNYIDYTLTGGWF